MARTPPVQQPPPVMKLLVTYGKTGPMRFASHRDFARCFERGLRRAHIPMAYSSGFNPHPRISYVNPAPTGAESEAEYLVIGLRELCDPANVRTQLDAAMPEGFPILEVSEATDQTFDASIWEVHLPGATEESLATSVAEFLAAPEAIVSRETKNGLRTFDAKPAVESLTVTGSETLTMVIRHTEPLIRPDDVVSALHQFGLVSDLPLLKRLRQGAPADLA